jgi:AcrR family transcriptional regulator
MNENAPTRDRLIEAAKVIFADKGYEAASVREITAAAAANLGAITYHFGSKQGLYEAVLDSLLEPLVRSVGLGQPVASDASGKALDRIEAMVAQVFEHLAANPDLQLLVLQHVATRQALPAPIYDRLPLLVGRLAAEVARGQADGSIRAGDPVLMAFSVIAQPMYFGLVSRFAPDRLKGAGGKTPTAAALSAHAGQFIRSGLAAGTEEENG